MGKIYFGKDATGTVVTTGSIMLNGRPKTIMAPIAENEEKARADKGLWRQGVLDLFERKVMLQNGASEPEGGQ